MKKIFFALAAIFCISLTVNAQVEMVKTLPSVNIKTIDGKTFNASDICSGENAGHPIIISFWALWCKNCIKELNAINDVYEDWQDETGVILYAVSIDDAQRNANVKSFANSKGWEYELLLDANQDFKRAMNVGNIPHTFVLNGKGEVVWQHTSYFDGAENELFEAVKQAAKSK
ncbi:MAG: TlpA disulfide reductase family protein [Bacteroidales bacterium]|jgi:cytochrome c biogenesis protein CcmG, thiol:disulfide interchange protein DsbE|nr:TlpA family protein disulfide reductase [Bacteroidales bacterium]MDD2204351.1 TlpA disulfide reductase family protein [Bacteroidales bacterium]MDD3151743.1 TlpA disulfide reductase family protein [Bacteroidales bacterium]MDD3913877.1 TlpA disulfide reductase family protein [Bacteroidales bacterium]MDD4634548.1 TlpA disulfide reductase family protein [Bacteroidales bacterium]